MEFIKLMKVILLQDIRGIGKRNDIKDLSDGYVKNFLLPKGLAKPATDSAVRDAKTKIESDVKELASLKRELQTLENTTKNQPIVLKIKTGAHKEVFGSISSEEIIKNLEFRGFKNIELEGYHPIRSLGKHAIKINLGRGVKGEIIIEVVPQ